ncbi:MAG: DUF4838 domain-containing protein [Marinilabiliales bacterium]|nr:DUF4838 domain-containing protein [Marinilabiliales bacterium]
MKTMKLLLFAMMLHWGLTAFCASALQPAKFEEGKYLKNWMLLGPFPLQGKEGDAKIWKHLEGYDKDYLTSQGGERALVIQPKSPVKAGKKSLAWKYLASNDSIIDLYAAISHDYPVMAYAYTEIQVEEEGVRMLGLGSNDGSTLFVNGKQVFDYPASRGVRIDGDLVPVLLKKGINSLLMKVEQHGNKWGFCIRMHPFSGAEALQRGDLFKIWADETGTAKVLSSYPDDILNSLVGKLILSVTDHSGKEMIREERTDHFCKPLNLSTTQYQPYAAKLTVRMKSGPELQKELEFSAGKRREYTLFDHGKSDYRISLPSTASESEKWAAGELQHWLKEMSGIELPLLPFDQNYQGPQIIVGAPSPEFDASGDALQQESFHYRNVNQNILISGGKQRGTMYGVFEFLENELGLRWYTPSATYLPKREDWKFVWLDRSGKPGVRVRNDFYFEAFDPIWATRNKMNGAMGYRVQPGGIESYWAVHTFYPLMPPEEFYKKHPEYYSLINGKRIYERAQLCLSNPNVLRIITERIKKRMHESPEYLIYDVSQNDWHHPCQCDKCQAIAKQYGGESGVIIWFVNKVAEAVEKEFPDKFIGTLAYQYTRKPPVNIQPRENVVVRLCSIECCFAHDFHSCPENVSFLDDLKGWSAIAPHLYIWDYVVNFNHYVMPYPNFKVLQSNIQTFRDNHAIGIMEQAAYQSRGGEFAELRAYLISKLLWNPECNTAEVIDDFIYGYYGRAGRFVRQYFDLLQNRVTPDTHIHLGLTPGDPIFSDDFVMKAQEIFRQALRAADSDEMVRRVEMCSLPILYLKCRRLPALSRQDGTYADFCRIAAREKVLNYSEAGEPERKAFHAFVENAQ